MEKFIPYKKLSKKEKRKLDQAKRQTWGNLNPVTRKPENSKAYNRKKTQDWKKEFSNPAFYFSIKGQCAVFHFLNQCAHATILFCGITQSSRSGHR